MRKFRTQGVHTGRGFLYSAFYFALLSRLDSPERARVSLMKMSSSEEYLVVIDMVVNKPKKKVLGSPLVEISHQNGLVRYFFQHSEFRLLVCTASLEHMCLLISEIPCGNSLGKSQKIRVGVERPLFASLSAILTRTFLLFFLFFNPSHTNGNAEPSLSTVSVLYAGPYFFYLFCPFFL